MKTIARVDEIQKRIYLIRGQKVLVDYDLAVLYGVATKNLKRAVRRNRDRFPKASQRQTTGERMAFVRSCSRGHV